jgi:hypothetical protein
VAVRNTALGLSYQLSNRKTMGSHPNVNLKYRLLQILKILRMHVTPSAQGIQTNNATPENSRLNPGLLGSFLN